MPTGYEIDSEWTAEGFRCSTCGGLVLAERKGKRPRSAVRAACPAVACGFSAFPSMRSSPWTKGSVVPDERMVCKHCGGEDFHAEVSARGWVDSTGVFLEDNGKPHFEPNGRVQDTWDYDIDNYVCSNCEKTHFRLEQLVIPAPRPDGEPIAPCGRCDHGRAEHPEIPSMRTRQLGLERGPMRCTHEGCDCHDYYDVTIAEAGQPADVLAAVGRAAA